MKKYLAPFILLLSVNAFAQKKPLDHTVYDGWKSVGEHLVSNNGAFVVYTVNPQEGDGELVIQNPSTKYKKVIPRGYNAVITEDSRFLVFRIKPFFQDTRQAKIKKKKGDDMPKDSLGIIELGSDSLVKIARAKSFKTPEKAAGYLAYLMDKPLPDTTKKKSVAPDSATLQKNKLVQLADSVIKHSIDSIKGNISTGELTNIINKAASQILKKGKDLQDAEGDEGPGANAADGTNLVLRNLTDGSETIFYLVKEFYFDQQGKRLLIETTRDSKDSNSIARVLLYHIADQKTDTVMERFNDAKNYSFDESGNQLAFVAERDSSDKALTRFYKLWYYTAGQDSARLIADKNTNGMRLGFTVSENASISFSKNAGKLFFGTAPVPVPKDTTLVDFETVKVDIWNYKDDYLQPQQLKNLNAELKRSYTTVYNIASNRMVQLGAEDAETITLVDEGNADWVLAESNKGNRVALQWMGRTLSTAALISTTDGTRKNIYKNQYFNASPSPAGKFVFWFNPELKQYFTYEVATGTTRNITGKIKMPLYDEENDVPDYADPYGVMGWTKEDRDLLLYDRYEIWKVSPAALYAPAPFLSASLEARKKKTTYRYIPTDRDERFVPGGQQLVFRVFDNVTKRSAFQFSLVDTPLNFLTNGLDTNWYDKLVKAKQAMHFIFTKESYNASPDLYYAGHKTGDGDTLYSSWNFDQYATRLSNINPQQADYNWMSAELFHWKSYDGKQATGILYKPENYDPKKKYPLLCYFYERLSDNLYRYQAPAPTPSRLNIPFFVSRGYLVLAPDIAYTEGHPGNSAYNYIASGARALVKQGWVDSTRIGIQGQSWGGYQVAYLITKTRLFRAAWAGAPVANMTSAYGGIRWGSGLNRQFQYEKTQSRIGATLWQKPELYIENSPLFHLPNVQTPLVIMHNDGDGAVPWYQGIELFTGLRRLGKPVWLLNYNGEEHNIMERKNRKDIQVREHQFFDWQLKYEPPAKWLIEGVPATQKGKNWGLELE